MQDLAGMNMETEFDRDWSAQQAQDEAIQKREVMEAFERIYMAINRLEIVDNCEYVDLRKDVRFIELMMWRK